ncbi:MAG: lanthionine synthetase LanC family protein, partial [Candidatus Promineifilaceae bacterium]
LPACVTAWCHGAPGIGLARIGMLPYYDTSEIRQEIRIATETTLAQGTGHNHSLCHGGLGNLELVLQAIPHIPEVRQQYGQCLTEIVHRMDLGEYICGVPLGVTTPGLMTGLAGIGYQLLRFADPDKIPSVLTLQPPIMG